jgi:chromosome partitioning protein
MRVISVVNMKGGSCKTTVATALAVGATRLLKGRVLLIDADPQASSSLLLGSEAERPKGPSLREVLLDEVAAVDTITRTRIGRLDLLQADAGLADCSALLAEEVGRELRLKRAIRPLSKRYSLVVIDGPPGLTLIQIAVLKASDSIVVPVEAFLSVVGLGKLRETVQQVRDYLDHPHLAIIGLAIQKAMRNQQSKELERELRKVYGSLVYRSVTPFSPAVEQASRMGRTVLETAPGSAVSLAFTQLIREILYGKRTRRGGGAAATNGDGGAGGRPGRRRKPSAVKAGRTR